MASMSLLILASFIGFVVSDTTESPVLTSSYLKDDTDFNLTGRIVNGTKALPRQFPHQVSIRTSWSGRHFCGGSVIAKEWVLTAAHCMFDNRVMLEPWMLQVVGGQIQIHPNGVNSKLTGQTVGVEQIIVHNKFNIFTLRNDVALLKLSAAFKITPDLRPAILAGSEATNNLVCEVSGWGYPEEDIHVVTNDLMYVSLPIIEAEDCRALVAGLFKVPEGSICAGWKEGMRDACQGDSGGAMMCNGVLTAIVSGGKGCAIPNLPGLYAEVYFYTDWIYKQVQTVKMRKINGNGASVTNGSLLLLLSCFVALITLRFS